MSEQLDPAGLQQRVSEILAQAKAQGADQAEAAATIDQGLAVTVRDQTVETLEQQSDRAIAITVYKTGSEGFSRGSASTADFSSEALRDTVAAAVAIAGHTQADACAGLAEPEQLATDWPDLDLDHPWALTPPEAEKIGCELERAGLAVDDRLSNPEGCNVNTGRHLRVFGNSHGFLGSEISTGHNLTCMLLANGEQGMQRDYYYSAARSAKDLDSPQSIGQLAAERTLRRLNPQSVATQQCPVLFSPELARGLFRSLAGAIAGGALYRRSSFLLDSLGEQVLADHIHIVEDPFVPRGMASSGYDRDGVQVCRRDLVSAGVLGGYLLSVYSARRLNSQPTGNGGGIHNWLISGRSLSESALLAEMGTGLLVTELMGQGVNGVTGDYSRGASGFWVENGQIAYPVEGITIAGNLKQMFQQIVALGTDIDRRGAIQVGSVLLETMTVAGA